MRIWSFFQRQPKWLRYGIIFSIAAHSFIFGNWIYFSSRGYNYSPYEIKSVDAEFLGEIDFEIDDISNETSTLGDGETGVAREFENEAEETVEQITGVDRAPTENVSEDASNFTQTEENIAPPVQSNNVSSETSNAEDSVTQEAVAANEYTRDIPLSDVKTPDRPAALRTIAKREEAGTSRSGGKKITATLGQAIAQRIARCFRPPVGSPNQRVGAIPLYITFSQDGYVLEAILKKDYRPSSSAEGAFAEASLQAARHPNCQPFPTPEGGFDEGQQILFNFHPPTR